MMMKLIPTSRVARVAISLAVLASLVTISVIVAGATGGSAENPLARDAQDYAVQFGTTVDEAVAIAASSMSLSHPLCPMEDR